MPAATISVSHEFMFSYIHGLWAKAIRGERLNALIRAENEEQLVQLLKEKGIQAHNYHEFHRNLQLREIAILKGIQGKLDPKTARFYQALLRKGYYQNIKTLLHDRFFREQDDNLEFLIVNVPGAEINAREAVRAERTEDFIKCLNLKPQDREPIGKCIQNLEKTRDIIQAECVVDQLAYDNLEKAAAQLPADRRDSARKLVRQEIDIINVCALLRIVRTYRFPAQTVKTMWLENGELLTRQKLTEISQAKAVKDAIAQLPGTMRKTLDPIKAGELYLLEKKLWNQQYREATRIFRETKNFAQVIVAFPFLQHAETKNIGRIYEGVHFGVQPKDLFDMIIEGQ